MEKNRYHLWSYIYITICTRMLYASDTVFKFPFTACLAAGTKCGKTEWAKKMSNMPIK